MLKKAKGVKIAMESIAALQQAISSQKQAEQKPADDESFPEPSNEAAA